MDRVRVLERNPTDSVDAGHLSTLGRARACGAFGGISAKPPYVSLLQPPLPRRLSQRLRRCCATAAVNQKPGRAGERVPSKNDLLSRLAMFRGPNVGSRIGSTMRSAAGPGRKTPANDAVPRRSSLSVVVPDSACHAGGRGFESRRSVQKTLSNGLFCCRMRERRSDPGSKRSKQDARGAVVGRNQRGPAQTCRPPRIQRKVADEIVT